MEDAMAKVNPVQIQKFLKGVGYPASKATLIENAKKMGADDNVCSSLEQLPAEEEFQTPADVSQAIGRLSEESGEAASAAGGNEFIAQAAQDSLEEIELCEMALQKTSNDDIKGFAQRLIDDHSELGREIEQCGAGKNIPLPKDVKSEQNAKMQELSALSGQDFDRKFIEHNVKDHEEDIKVFQHYASEESDPDIKALAERGVRMLTEHLKMAKQTQQKL